MIPLMTKQADDRSYRTERLGLVLRRVAGKLAAERNSARPAGNPTAVEPGNRGERIADVEQARSAGPTRLKKGPTDSGQGGAHGSMCAGARWGENVIQFATLGRRGTAGLAPIASLLKGAGPADSHVVAPPKRRRTASATNFIFGSISSQ
jgi:hypothetical protein